MEFQDFINLTWPFVAVGFLLRFFCWSIAEGCNWIRISIGDEKDLD